MFIVDTTEVMIVLNIIAMNNINPAITVMMVDDYKYASPSWLGILRATTYHHGSYDYYGRYEYYDY